MKRNITIIFILVFTFIFLHYSGIGAAIAAINYPKQHVVEEFPDRPISLIVPASAGGSLDLLARTLEEQSSKYLRQPLVIKNIPGNVQGWNRLIESQPDGYTLSLVGPGMILQPLQHEAKYNYLTAIDPIAQIMCPPLVLSVLTDQHWDNLNGLIKYAKDNPHQIKFGHSSFGAIRHITGEMFGKQANIKIDQVQFAGGTEEVAALLGRHVQFIITDPSEVRDFARYGSIKVLAVSSEKRLTDPEFRDVPTFKEQGLDVVMEQWIGIGVSKELPQNVKIKLTDGFRKIVNDPDFVQNMKVQGMTVTYLDSKAFAEKWLKENERFKKILKDIEIDKLL